MENIHDEAARYGIERPELEYREYYDQDEAKVISLTAESDQDWSDYMRRISVARVTQGVGQLAMDKS